MQEIGSYRRKTKKVQLFVHCFKNLTREELESIEAEFALLIRQKTGEWPLAQNEIHFNNNFEQGPTIAKEIYRRIKNEEMKIKNL